MRKEMRQLITLALREDFGKAGDITSRAIFKNEGASAVLIGKSAGILAGSEIFTEVFKQIDPTVSVEFFYSDGSLLKPGQQVGRVEGKARALLGGERTALNFLSFLSGIATKVRTFVAEARQYGPTIVLDTRKTLPGYRELSKYAVRVGGGQNHRQGLFEMALIKDNHIDACGSLTEAVRRVRLLWQDRYKIEAECRTIEEVNEALALHVDFLMLDNMEVSRIAESLRAIAGRIPVEISGGVEFSRLKDLIPLGAEFISVGSLTNSVTAFDFSLKISIG
jgi:nicotinate-nucleotide pyrophosphorylase (carboxylating)